MTHTVDIFYIISSLPRLPHTALTVFGNDCYLMLNIHSIKQVSSVVVDLTSKDYDMTVMMIMPAQVMMNSVD